MDCRIKYDNDIKQRAITAYGKYDNDIKQRAITAYGFIAKENIK